MFKPWLWLKQFSWFIVGTEELPEDPALPRGAVFGGLLKRLLESEDLPSDPVRRRPRKGYLRGIMEQEELPQDPIPSKKREGFLCILLKSETLPREGGQE